MRIVSFSFYTLHPGDVLLTGTPRIDAGCSNSSSLEKANAVLPVWARTAFACKNYCFFSFAGSAVVAELLLLEGELVEPLIDPLGADEPPAAESFFSASAVAEELELEPDGALGVTLTEPEAELDGALGVVVEPAEDEDEPAGGVVLETARSPASLSQPVSNPAPSARDTATARVESLMWWASMVGVSLKEQGLGPSR